MIDDKHKLWSEFDECGEVEIRQRLANQVYGESKTFAVKAWLQHRVSQRSEAAMSEQLSIARDSVVAS
ncbi:MAG: hypothetical protein EB059_05000 [Alphaproteobacteria bacterium]|nr:hypothetical protein [Alphaproteobacteria bacterium]